MRIRKDLFVSEKESLSKREKKFRMWTSANSIVNMYLIFPFS